MPKHYFRKLAPGTEKIKGHRILRFLGNRLHDPALWHFNRRSVAGAFGIGLFTAFLPIPGQMLVAALLAILVEVNLPLSVLLVWVTNPLTMAPVFYAAYRLGAWLLDRPPLAVGEPRGLAWFADSVSQIWQPLLVGGVTLGVASGLAGYVAVRVLWRLAVISQVRARRRR